MRHPAAALTLAALLAASGCGDAGDTSGPFDAGRGTAPLTCMRHQWHTPPKDYTGDTARTLGLLRYYTANRARPYCDHKAATPADRAWTRLYARLVAPVS